MFKIFAFSILLSFLVLDNGDAQYDFSENKINNITWCNKNIEEQYKCLNLTHAIERDYALFDDYIMNLTCLLAESAYECIHYIDREKAHVTTLDAGDVFFAGRYNSLVPIMQEKFEGGFTNYYSVAVVKKYSKSYINSLNDLRNKKACFPWVGSLAGWIIPIYTLQNEAGMEVVDCNNQVKTAANFFNFSCAVYSLNDRYNPIGDNSDKLCNLCTGKSPGGRCTHKDPYFGFNGAFRCLMEAGEVAFLRHTTVSEMLQTNEFSSISEDRFRLLCKDGRRVPLTDFRECNWGLIPSDAIVTSSARNQNERKKYQKFLQQIVKLYSEDNTSNIKFKNDRENSNYYYEDKIDDGFTKNRNNIKANQSIPYERFQIFESKRYGGTNLMFQESAKSFHLITEENQSFLSYLESSITFIYDMSTCPIGQMTLCVTSEAEFEKCIKMQIALKAQLLKPELRCYKAHSHITCMQSIKTGRADIAVFDAGDVYTAGLNYDLIPFMAEIYNLDEPEYYVVAVAKEEDPDTELTYLKGKYTCHTGINTAAGWTYPMAYLISNGWIRPYGCDSVRAAAEYFTKSCIPGAISSEYNTGVPYDSMCDLCHGNSYRYCRRDASEDYYGHTGAFRCLVEGGGHVAFVKHTTVMENTGGKRKEWWARNTLNDDFELLCTDGTRAELNDYRKCNLGRVKANAIVTRGGEGYNGTLLNTYINLLTYAQQLYGRKDVDDFSFSMFSSPDSTYDLIFQDATRQLKVIPPEKRRYDLYLGHNFMRARRITDCYAGTIQIQISTLLLLISSALVMIFLK